MESTEQATATRKRKVRMKIYPSTEAPGEDGERSKWTGEELQSFVDRFKAGEILGPIKLLREHGDRKAIRESAERFRHSGGGGWHPESDDVSLGQMVDFHYNPVEGWLYGVAELDRESVVREIKDGALGKVSFSYMFWNQRQGEQRHKALEVSLTSDPDFPDASVIACHNSSAQSWLVWPLEYGPGYKRMVIPSDESPASSHSTLPKASASSPPPSGQEDSSHQAQPPKQGKHTNRL